MTAFSLDFFSVWEVEKIEETWEDMGSFGKTWEDLGSREDLVRLGK